MRARGTRQGAFTAPAACSFDLGTVEVLWAPFHCLGPPCGTQRVAAVKADRILGRETSSHEKVHLFSGIYPQGELLNILNHDAKELKIPRQTTCDPH